MEKAALFRNLCLFQPAFLRFLGRFSLQYLQGKIFWREIIFDRNNVFLGRLIDAHSVVHNRPYDINPYDWFRAAFGIHLGPRHRLDTFWCSALVSYMYTRFGILNEDLDWTY